MKFKKYGSIENHYRQKIINNIIENEQKNYNVENISPKLKEKITESVELLIDSLIEAEKNIKNTILFKLYF